MFPAKLQGRIFPFMKEVWCYYADTLTIWFLRQKHVTISVMFLSERLKFAFQWKVLLLTYYFPGIEYEGQLLLNAYWLINYNT